MGPLQSSSLQQGQKDNERNMKDNKIERKRKCILAINNVQDKSSHVCICSGRDVWSDS